MITLHSNRVYKKLNNNLVVMITIKTYGQGVFKIPEGITSLSPKLEKMVTDGEILLYDVDVETFLLLYDFYKFYITLSQVETEVLKDLNKLKETHKNIRKWYVTYVNVSLRTLIKILKTAQDLEFRVLPNVICHRLGEIIAQTSVNDIGNMFD